VETVLELSGTDPAFSELLATQPESLPSQAGDRAEMAPKIDFPACCAREARRDPARPAVMPDPAQLANMPQG
jgi:hypothetical protein